MPGPISSPDRSYDRSRYATAFQEIQTTTPMAWGAAFSEAWQDTLTMAPYRMLELDAARGQESPLVTATARAIGGPTGGIVADVMADTIGPYIPKSPKISEDIFNESYAQLGLKWDPDMTEAAAKVMAARKKRELWNQETMARGQGGAVENVGKFGAALVANLLSPPDIALSFLPIVGEGRWAAWVSKMGLQRARVARGAVEGVAGAAVAEPFIAAARTQEQADYTAMNTLSNVMMGAVLGGGLHVLAGEAKDWNASRKWAELMTGPEGRADMRAIDAAARQLADGKGVDISAVHAMNEVEIRETRAKFMSEVFDQAGSDARLREAEAITRTQAADTVRSQQNPDRSLDVTREALDINPETRDRMAELEPDAAEKDLQLAQERFKEVLGGQELDEADAASMKLADEFAQEAEVQTSFLRQAIDCVLGGDE